MNEIVILGLISGCKPCTNLKAKLDERGVAYDFFDVKERGNPKIQELKKDLTKHRYSSVPAVWVDGQFIGGKQQILEIIDAG